MTADPFCTEIHKRLCAMDLNEVVKSGTNETLVKIANQVAREHPFWYERFRLGAVLCRWFGR